MKHKTHFCIESDRGLPRSHREEERVVAELELLGIRYLSRYTSDRAERVRSPDILLADLVQQPSARVRAAVIAVLWSTRSSARCPSARTSWLRTSGR